MAWAAGAALVVGGGTAGIVIAAQGGTQAPSAAAAATARLQSLRLVSISDVPANGTTGSPAVNGAADITVTYNQPLPAKAPVPAVSPAIAGSWHRKGDTVVFTPTTGFPPGTHITVTAMAKDSGASPSFTTASFTTGNYSTLRLQEVIAQLGYLPMTWTPAADAAAPGANAAAQLSAAYTPPAGSFQWQQGYPSQLSSLWSQGKANTLDKGAIMEFESDHGLSINGVAGTAVWKALLTAAAKNQRNTHGYNYAIANQRQPETLTIWHNGKKVFSSPANTGIAAAPTALGTFPVYLKYQFQIMSGTNPDGSSYADPVQWVSYFNGGDAVHYFPRGSYGWPQSLGCVELPSNTAEQAYSYLPYGSLVTVTGA